MFYLLENNKIIDTIKALHNVDEIIIEEDENEKYLYLVGWLGKHFCGKIKKQSENVFELIEEEDLVKLDKTLNQVITILKEDKRTIFEIGDNKWFSFKELNNYLNNNRLAIYKPDDKGNYIKVWERKEEDETCNGTD